MIFEQGKTTSSQAEINVRSWRSIWRTLINTRHLRNGLLVGGIVVLSYGLIFGPSIGLSAGLNAMFSPGLLSRLSYGLIFGLCAGLSVGLGYWLLLGLLTGLSSFALRDEQERAIVLMVKESSRGPSFFHHIFTRSSRTPMKQPAILLCGGL